MSDGPNTQSARPRRRSLWRHREFMKLWTGETISQLGTQVTLLALPLTAVVILKANAFQVGLLSTLEFIPFILVGLPAGVWVDRLRRRPILIAGDLLRALTLGSIPLAYKLHTLHMGQLYVVAFITGIGTVFFDVAYQSYLPSLVDRDQIVDGNSKLEISRSGAQLAGPGLAGFLIQTIKAPLAILIDAVSYLCSALFIGLIRKPEPPVETHAEGHRPKMRTQIREGLRYVWRHELLRPIAFCTATANLFGSMIMAVLILFAVRVLHLKAGEIGLIFALGNVGFLLGAFTAQRIAKRVGIGPAIVWSIGLTAPASVLVPLATPSTAFLFLVIQGFVLGWGGMAVYNINQVSLRQAITPDRMQGKMNATMRFMVWGTMPVGSFVAGILGRSIGLRPTLWIGAIGGMLAFLWPLFSPVRRLRVIPGASVEQTPDTFEKALVAAEEGISEPGSVAHP
jgi:MFS family permease